MPKGTGRLVHSQGVKCIASPMTLGDFHTHAKQYLTNITAAEAPLKDAYKLFGEGNDIWPDQCGRAIAVIHRLEEPIEGFCKLLDTTAQLPMAVIPLRYPVAVTLHHMDEQVCELKPLITQFRATCRTSLEPIIKQPISLRFERLIDGCLDLEQKVPALLDQTRFQERKLAKL